MLGFQFLAVLDVIPTFLRETRPKEKQWDAIIFIQITLTDVNYKIMHAYYETKHFAPAHGEDMIDFLKIMK